jgi:hypothetical protein
MREWLAKMAIEIYVYCTDFIINLANLTNTSYYEVNAFIFCFLWIIITLALAIVLIIQFLRLQKARKSFL